MQITQPIEFRCPACGYQSREMAVTIVDAQQNPENKRALLNGSLNMIPCGNCGNPSAASVPMVYHDATKELLITLVPMNLGMNAVDSDKFIGALLREITSNTDAKLIKGYIFQPRRALTLQGLIEQVLEADGVTREMLDAQKERTRLVQLFLQTEPSQIASLAQEHDAKIDQSFFQTMSLVAQQYLQQGQPQVTEQILMVQQLIAENSTVGKALLEKSQQQEQLLESIAAQLDTLPDTPTPEQVWALLQPYIANEEAVEAFVGMARPLFDERFDRMLAALIEAASVDEKTTLSNLRDKIEQMAQQVDQQTQMRLQEAANRLRQVLTSPDPVTLIRDNPEMIDDMFMTVLEMNIREAERQGDIAASARLKGIREQIIAVIQSNMRPDVRFINDLLSVDPATADEMLKKHAPDFGAPLLETFDALLEVVATQGEPQLLARLEQLKQQTKAILG